MVLFLNIVIGQYVEIRHQNKIVCGTVKYKGHLNGEEGNWVGVQLEYPLGRHNGCWRGRQYFKCPANCGLFTHACNIQFRRNSRRLFDKYKRKEVDSDEEPQLHPEYSSCYSIDKQYLSRAKSAFSDVEYHDMFGKEERYPLRHAISSTVNPVISSRHPVQEHPIHYEFSPEQSYFGSTNASIPHYMLPHEAQLSQMRRGGFNNSPLPQPRFLSV